jgi:aspartyl-tRNA(Asn)/glutamyl-tRNA(Gln) amidotransferase subunit A
MDVKDTTIAEAAAAVSAGELSPVELLQASLDAIESWEPRIGALVTVLTDSATRSAERAEAEIRAGNYRGPLHGIPIAIKDLYDMAGLPTTCSSKVRAGHVATDDSAVVERLRDAGAVLLGKAHTHEFAYGVVTPNTRNPWDTGHIPGGSSGGSGAAVASGEALAAMGSDTGGSIRIPASVCGVTGLKPTYGRVSKYGVAPLSWSLDHAGPLARTVRDAGLVLQAIAGPDPRDPTTVDVPVPDFLADIDRGVDGLVLGIPTNFYFDAVHPEVELAVRAAIGVLEAAGAKVRPFEVPLAEFIVGTEFGICMPEATAYHQANVRTKADLYEPDVRTFLEAGEFLLATDYLKALRARHKIKEAWREAFEGIDALLAPSLPNVAAKVGQEVFELPDGTREAVISAYVRLSCPADVTGLPAMSVPCGFNSEGLPIGLQIIGRPYDEGTVLRVGQAYEAATQWTTRAGSAA